MSHYESSFRGLSAPTQAGLALSVLLTAAMVAASPAIDTSILSSEWEALGHLSSNGMPTSWLAHMQQDTLPLLNQKLDLVLSGLSPKAEAVLGQARLQSMNFQSNAAAATQQMQSFMSEQTVKLQGSFNEFLDIAKAKSVEWQGVGTAETSRIEAQSLLMMQHLEAATTSRLAESQTVYKQTVNELTTKGSNMVESAMLQASIIQNAATSTAEHLQSAINAQAEDVKGIVLPKLEQAMAQTKESVSFFQKTVDETLLREGPMVRDEIDRSVLSPIRLEMKREADLLQASASTTSSHLQATWDTASAGFERIILTMSQNMVDFFADSKVALTDGSIHFRASLFTTGAKFQTELISKVTEARDIDIPRASEEIAILKENFFVKREEFQSQTLSAMEQFETAAASHIAEARSMYAQITEDATAKASKATENFLLQTSFAGENILRVSAHIRSALQDASKQIQSTVVLPMERSLALSKQSIDSLQKVVDSAMLREGPVLRSETDRYILSPMAEAMKAFRETVEVEMAREADLLKTSALTTNSHIHAIWKIKSAEFESIILQMSKNMVNFFADSKLAVAKEALQLQAFVNSKCDELSEIDVPFAKEELGSFLKNTKATIASATSNLQYSIPTSQQPKESVHLNLANLEKSIGDFLREETHKLNDFLNEDASSLKIRFEASSTQVPLPEAASAETVVSETLPSQYDRLQSRLMNSL